MIHTAEEILLDIFNPYPNDDSPTWREDLQLAITLNPSLELIEKAINEARIEAIKECADKLLFKDNSSLTDNPYEKILTLLDQIK